MREDHLTKAIWFAAEWHQGQVDKRGEPYILHPLRVMHAVREAGYPGYAQTLAVLHDVMEDTDASWVAVEHMFGPGMVRSLSAITRNYEPEEGYDEYGAKKRGEPRETHWEYFLRCVKDPDARVVKYYDVLDNMDPKRFNDDSPYSRYQKILRWYRENGVEE